MTTISAFILYLTVFRLSIIAAGIVSIILGYRLFCKGILPETGTGTTIAAEIGENRFRMRNAAPGTCFALFGVIIISVMFFNGSPEITLDLINRIPKVMTNASALKNGTESSMSLKLRGDEEKGLSAYTEKGRYFEERGETDKAMDAYQEAVDMVAKPMNYLAWIYHSKGEDVKALNLAKMAVQFSPDNGNAIDTLAEIQFTAGNHDIALELMERAAGLDHRFKTKLEKFRKLINSSK